MQSGMNDINRSSQNQILDMIEEAVHDKEQDVKKPSCRMITLRSFIIIVTFVIVLTNLIFSFVKELISKTEFWDNMKHIMDQYIWYKISMKYNTTVYKNESPKELSLHKIIDASNLTIER